MEEMLSIWALETGTLWAVEMASAPPAPVEPRAPAVFGEVHRWDYPALEQAVGSPAAEALLDRFSASRRCFAAWLDGHIAAYGWVSQKDERIGELERCIQLAADEAYIWDCVTLPDYRRFRLYSALLSHMLAVLDREGVRRVWIGSALSNRPSIKGFANAGFQPVITVLYLRLFKIRWFWVRGYSQAPAHLVEAARQAMIDPLERTLGPLAFGIAGAAPFSGCVQMEGQQNKMQSETL